MKFNVFMKMTVIPEHAETVDEGRLEVTGEANRIINELNRCNDIPTIDLLKVKYVTPCTMRDLQSVDEARELREMRDDEYEDLI